MDWTFTWSAIPRYSTFANVSTLSSRPRFQAAPFPGKPSPTLSRTLLSRWLIPPARIMRRRTIRRQQPGAYVFYRTSRGHRLATKTLFVSLPLCRCPAWSNRHRKRRTVFGFSELEQSGRRGEYGGVLYHLVLIVQCIHQQTRCRHGHRLSPLVSGMQSLNQTPRTCILERAIPVLGKPSRTRRLPRPTTLPSLSLESMSYFHERN